MTSPPYDVVVRPDGLHHLESADPHNIVRLILPQADTPAARNEQAADTLRRWLAEGILAADPEPALYVYEQRRRRASCSAASSAPCACPSRPRASSCPTRTSCRTSSRTARP